MRCKKARYQLGISLASAWPDRRAWMAVRRHPGTAGKGSRSGGGRVEVASREALLALMLHGGARDSVAFGCGPKGQTAVKKADLICTSKCIECA